MSGAGSSRRRPRATALLGLTFLLLAAAGLSAELSSSVTVTGYTSLLRYEDAVALRASLESSLDLHSEGNRNVKGHFQLKSLITDEYLFLDVPRAYLKVRFPWFRLTLGKTRLSWGDGFVFNAGDVIFGSMRAIGGDLSAESLRDETAWLAALYLPLGDFSFLEGVLFPYDIAAGTLLAGPQGAGKDVFSLDDLLSLGLSGFSDLAGGLRGVFKLGRTTLEAGYFAIGQGVLEHRPYLSLHGHLLADWNLSASLAIPMEGADWGLWGEWLSLSAGLFRLFNLGPGRSLSARLEAALRPGAPWGEEPDGRDYALFLFPELALALSDTLSLQLRSLVSPLDRSAFSLAGVSWNVYQGLTVLGYLSFMAGDADDLYAWSGDYGITCTLGLEFVY